MSFPTQPASSSLSSPTMAPHASSLQPQGISSTDRDVSMIESMVDTPAEPSQRAAAQPHIKAGDREQAKTSDKQPNRISDQQYMSAFSQYKVLYVSMAPKGYTPEQIAAQINKLQTTVFRGKEITDVTKEEVAELQQLITKNRNDKRAAYAKFKQDRNSDTLSTKMAALNKSAGERLGRLGVTVGKSFDSLKATTKEKISDLTFSFGKKSAVDESAANALSKVTATEPQMVAALSTVESSPIRPSITGETKSIFGDDADFDKNILFKQNTRPKPLMSPRPNPNHPLFREDYPDDDNAPPQSRADRLAKARSAKLFDDDDDDPLAENYANDSSPISSKSQPLDKKIQYVSPVSKVLFNVSVNANDNGTVTLSFDESVSSGTLFRYMNENNIFSGFDEFKGTAIVHVTTSFLRKSPSIMIHITVNRSVYDTFCKDVLNKNTEWEFTLSKDSKKVVIPGTWVSKKQDGGKRKRTIKRKHRSIRDNTLRSKK